MHQQPAGAARYLVAPRYLAGPSTSATQQVADALQQAGWPQPRHRSTATLYTSPDQLRYALFTPNGARRLPGGPLIAWEFAARHQPGKPLAWTAAFTPSTPPEITADFARALAHDDPPDTGDTPHYLKTPSQLDAARQPLADARWIRDIGATDTAWYAPTDQAVLVGPATRQPDGRNWLAAVREATSLDVLWLAVLTPTTPDSLITALCLAITDPEPVLRHHLPAPNLGPVTVTRVT
jgi:hypothetical protein